MHCPAGWVGGVRLCGDGRSGGGSGQTVKSCSCQVSVVKRDYVESSGDLGVLPHCQVG